MPLAASAVMQRLADPSGIGDKTLSPPEDSSDAQSIRRRYRPSANVSLPNHSISQ